MMTTILHIDASVRRTDNHTQSYNSISKQLSAVFIDSWMSNSPKDTVIYRDVGLCPPAFISQDWIAAVFTKEAQRTAEQHALLALSDELIAEVVAADVILMSSPMYNYGMPAALKAWFDQVVRINQTFSFDLNRGDFPLEPTLSGKSLVLVTSTGEFGFEPGGIREHMNHLGPHVQVLSKYLGVEYMHEVRAEYQEFGDRRHALSVSQARSTLKTLACEMSQSCQ
ncbi:NAD(P)H-dependent oxidoreductase [Photobacterium galatheae]|uniref:FMN-dependent NADH-azoreductase n=1 Tax=Photobacterium galatheae TaxID=1654360 RepID=UPI00202CB629|nr:NAD(P)H-dependent oxidoreductase [Photobacterium galatheae]MCM0148762.1 NAD(P)H-dependent oxidoreductase [Photobacterium galatheae]